MNESEDSFLSCEVCNNPVKDDDDFCPDCGTIFTEGVFCNNHINIPAEGVCIICSLPFCKECGFRSNNHFLCNDHSNYEIYEGMARIYGTPDDTKAQYIKTCLEQNELHPVLFNRYSTFGGPGYKNSIFEKGDNSGSIITEIKVMVPCQKVLEAEKILESIEP